ncbi:serine/threonine-protein kinase [Tumidithrix elongata RA019]|uniref:Serine/threonine-protein kinase n=1 Tax=Tumidithrix elongata BACA0141 TaxID=2716417 RepID=A0AAW9Q5Q7_9CYAN|nr:serine/threonine-protein kinase [Tumidithrix elongata RA019]
MPTSATSMLGELLDQRYRIIQTLDCDCCSQAYLAEDSSKQSFSQCIIKCFRPADTDSATLATARELFFAEAPKLKQLGLQSDRCPNVLSFFEQDKEFFIVEEVIPGTALSNEIQSDQCFSDSEVTELLHEILITLKFIHAFQIVHGDLNPKNLIRRQSDRKIILVNFVMLRGICTPHLHSQNSTDPKTRSKPIVGTPSYIPPEQTEGQLTPSGDIYALGLTAIQLLTSLHPSQLNYNNITNALDWQVHASVSSDLSKILDRMVNHNQEERYQSAQEVLNDLYILDPNLAPTHVRLFGMKGDSKRKTLPLIVGGTAAAALIAGGAFYLTQSFSNDPAPTPTTVATETAPPALPFAPLKIKSTLTGHDGWVRAVAFSANGHTVVSGSYDKTLRLWDTKGGKAFLTLTEQSANVTGVNAIATSRDGNTFASAGTDKTIQLWNFRNGRPLNKLSGHTGPIYSLAFDATNKLLVSASADKTIKLWDWRAGKLIRTFSGHTGLVLSVAISPDGKAIASGSADKTIKIWDAATGKEIRTLKGHKSQVRAVAFSPDGKLIASTSQDLTVKLWDATTGNEIRSLTGHTSTILTLAFSPDGQIIATGGSDKTIKIWDVRTGKLLQTLTGHTLPVLSLAFSPKDRTLISGSTDKTIKVWK